MEINKENDKKISEHTKAVVNDAPGDIIEEPNDLFKV